MHIPSINYIAVVLAMLSSIVVGFVWYTPRVFGKTWMRLTGVQPGTGQSPVRPIIITIVVSFLTAWVLAGAVDISFHFYGGSFLLNSIFTALILWVGFTAARFITHDVFDRRPWQLTVLNVSHELVTLLIMAVIIGVWPA